MTRGLRLLAQIRERLEGAYDLDRWHWRADTPALDICVGAVLVQHTAWRNVEQALANLAAAGRISIDALSSAPEAELAALIRPAGMPLIKARRLKAFAGLVLAHGGLERLFLEGTEALRAALLATPGIGPETADVMLLYAAGRAVVVHDAYTARLLRRIGSGPAGDSYAAWSTWQDRLLPRDLEVRRRFHAGVVVHCKETCKSRPRCGACPLLGLCRQGTAVTLGAERGLEWSSLGPARGASWISRSSA